MDGKKYHFEDMPMKTVREYPKFIITPKGSAWVDGGHPWIYAEEVLREEGACENGALADAVSSKGKYLGTGFVSRESKIRLRLVSRNANDRFDEAFWRRRIRYGAYQAHALPPARGDAARGRTGDPRAL